MDLTCFNHFYNTVNARDAFITSDALGVSKLSEIGCCSPVKSTSASGSDGATAARLERVVMGEGGNKRSPSFLPEITFLKDSYIRCI